MNKILKSVLNPDQS